MTTVVDLHIHSTASDGEVDPGDVPQHAAAAGLSAVALTDHDTVNGVAEAQAAGERIGVRVVAGCEVSVAAWCGELHLLGYFVPLDEAVLQEVFTKLRRERVVRAEAIVRRLSELGVAVPLESVHRHAGSGTVGRPHVARALVDAGGASSVNEAFARYLADGGPAFVPKTLPDLQTITALIRGVGGVTSAAHLKERATKQTLVRLRDAGVDAVEVLHPAHDEGVVSRLSAWAAELGLLRSGGSDWHGRNDARDRRRSLGAQCVPGEWLEALEAVSGGRQARASEGR